MSAGPIAEGPNHAQSRGTEFFLRAIQTYIVDEAAGQLLAEVAQTLDIIDWLQEKVDGGDPRAVVEVRQQRMLLTRLMAMLDLREPEPEQAASAFVPPRVARARKAAQSRWAGHIKREDLPR